MFRIDKSDVKAGIPPLKEDVYVELDVLSGIFDNDTGRSRLRKSWQAV